MNTDCLPAGYEAPYGFGTSQFAVSADGSGWRVAAYDASGMRVEYAIVLSGDGDNRARASVFSGEPPVETRLQHPYRKDVGDPAPIAEWIDAIALADAMGKRVKEQGAWAEETLEAAVDRSVHRIVAYEDGEIATSDGAEVRAWLERMLETTAVRVELLGLRNHPVDDEHLDEHLLCRYTDGELDGWLPISVSTEWLHTAWLAHEWNTNGGAVRPRPWVMVKTSGNQVTRVDADHVISWPALAASPHVTPDLVDAQWLVVHIVGTDVAVVFPHERAHIAVRIDDDGALVTLSVDDAGLCEARHRRRADFEREWGQWLSGSQPTSDDHLRAGILRAEALVAAAEAAQ